MDNKIQNSIVVEVTRKSQFMGVQGSLIPVSIVLTQCATPRKPSTSSIPVRKDNISFIHIGKVNTSFCACCVLVN